MNYKKPMKPIFFSTPMVQAIQDDRKTQTRRVIDKDISNQFDIDVDGSICAYINRVTGDSYKPEDIASYQPGDILWVRETWKCIKYDSMDGDLGYGVEFKDGTRKYFEFEDNERFHKFGKYATKNGWQPSIFMPKEAARIFLLVEKVRVERLQGILINDMLAEGCVPKGVKGGQWQQWQRDYFMPLWDSIYAKRGYPYTYSSNPWVWVIEFKRISSRVT